MLPNILFILADDLGYGDVRALNPAGKIATLHIDRLAAEGMLFTDAHSCGAVCTPTRYGILTGRYAFRTALERGVLGALGPRMIEPGRLTLPALLKQFGYRTACVGKWHLGLNWPLRAGGVASNRTPQPAEVDFTRPIENGPNAVGFDYFFGISGAASQPPFIYIENDRCRGIPTVEKTFFHTGPAEPGYEGIELLPTIARRANEIIAEHATANKIIAQPLFLFFPLTAPHTPALPTPEFQGRSGINAYADFVMQVDDTIGQTLAALDRAGLADSTIVIFTSDHGCSPEADLPALAAKGHLPSYHFRGHKADIYEGGHRVPLVVRWPGQVAAGSRCDRLVSLNDFWATLAEIVGAELPDNAAEDSVSLLPLLLQGRADEYPRQSIIHYSFHGSFGITEGNWKLASCPGSGGWSYPRPGVDDASRLPPLQLFNLATDIGETTNLQQQHPEIVARLMALLEEQITAGRSTPGTPQANNRPIDIWKSARAAMEVPQGPLGDTTE